MRKPALPKITQPLIRRMVKRIVQQFDPEQVILFGSQARGDAGPDSDVDLLVVMPVKGNRLEKEVEIRGTLHDFLVPKDIIVTTPEDFAWRKDVVGTIEWPASHEGKVLYANGPLSTRGRCLMRASEAVLVLVREWIVLADHDLTVAAQVLKLGQAAPKEAVCFHAQQCVEKYLKAVLAYRSISFKKTHDLRALMDLVPRRYRPTLDGAMQDQMTNYASPTRYPRSGLNISGTAMRRAVTAARRVRREVRHKLPKATLPKKMK